MALKRVTVHGHIFSCEGQRGQNPSFSGIVKNTYLTFLTVLRVEGLMASHLQREINLARGVVRFSIYLV